MHGFSKVFFVLGLATTMVTPAAAASAASNIIRDCDANALMYCGALTIAEFSDKVARGDTKHTAAELHKIYYEEGKGITPAGISSAVEGVVYKDGRVTVGGKLVATGARSDGRVFLPGSVKDGAYWQRPTQVSFKSDALSAFVGMSHGTFMWAVLKSCGNITVATPVPKPTPSPTPIRTPSPSMTPVPTPSSTPSPTPVVLSASAQMPVTGMGLFSGAAGSSAIGLLVTQYARSRRKSRSSIKQK